MIIDFRREYRRPVLYKLRLPVIFHWGEHEENVAAGFTKDIGAEVACVLSSKCPPVGSQIRIEVLVPMREYSPSSLHIEGVGTVAKVFAEEGGSGFFFHGAFDEDRITCG